MRRQDAVASARVLEIQTVEADERIAKRLQIEPRTATYRISRIRILMTFLSDCRHITSRANTPRVR